jgi:Domain of unknown function (DUF4082)/Bacterial Ig-like domain (group 1)
MSTNVFLLAQAITTQTVFTSQTPAIANASDGVAYELGVKFRSSKNGQIGAIRYWKAASETGTHVGRIWSAAGVLLANVTFTNETASGWQEQALATPLNIQANTTYIVSVNVNSHYVATNNGLATAIVNGDLSTVADGSNGVYGNPGTFPTASYQNSNYFRDVVFNAVAVPTLNKVSGDNQTGTVGTTLPNALVVQVNSGSGNPQSGTTVNFAVTSGSGTISTTSAVTNASGQASTQLTLGTSAGTTIVTASVSGIGSVTFTATATVSALTGVRIFTSQTPAVANASDGVAYELGVKFRSSKNGQIGAIRYWKAASETGTHVGRIWSAAGVLLANVTFTNETASGWQEQALATPLNIQANTTYIVSVNVNSHYVATNNGLATAIVNGDLSTVADGSNGVYGNPGTFPTASYQNSNYFRDVVFNAGSTLIKVSGDSQANQVGTALPQSLVVQVVNSSNQPLSGVTVNFSVVSGGGLVSPTSGITNANGQASTTLTLGPSPGTNTVNASASGVGTVTFQATGLTFQPNSIVLENLKPGTREWLITITEDVPRIVGYAGATSVNRGEQLPIKVSMVQPGPFQIDVYRLGYYGGTGGRFITSSGVLNGITQPACVMTDPTTRLVECNWSTSYTLSVGVDWTSGVYVANLTELQTGQKTRVWFVVRDDDSRANIVFQSAFNTVLAYNSYGGYSVYSVNSINGQRAYKVSYDRPFVELTDDVSGFNAAHPIRWEYNMIRWLESQGYDVTYISEVDFQTRPQVLLQHKVFLSVGHDEYWTKEKRDLVEQARNAGINLGFFSANTCYWQVRFENSSTGQPNRVMVSYKSAPDPIEQQNPSAATYKFRSPQVNRPENALLGVMYTSDTGNVYGGYDFIVANASDPYYANTGLKNGDRLSLLVGYEWDSVVDGPTPSGVVLSSPSGLVILGRSTVVPNSVLPTFDEPAGQETLPTNFDYTISNAVRYTAPSGAKVFSTGSIQWVWGLDSDQVNPPREDNRAKQMVVNVFADMGVKPQSPSPNIIVP